METALYDITARQERTYWWYVGRLAVLRRLVAVATAGRRDLAILNLGCGTGATSEAFAALGRVTSADMSEHALDYCRARGLGDLVLCSADRLPFPDASFDLVLALDVVEHVADEAAALREIRRVLRPGAAAVLTVPAYPWLWSRMDDQAGHRRRYRRRAFARTLAGAGFAPVRAAYFNSLLFPLAIAQRAWERWIRPPAPGDSFLPAVPAPLNRALAAVLAAERRWLPRFSPPFGLSIAAIARR